MPKLIQGRDASTGPLRFIEFFSKLQEQSGEEGFIAVIEVCGFNDWLLETLPQYGAIDVVLIQPKKRPKVKTDRCDANSLSELLWINRDRIKQRMPIRGVRRVVVPDPIHIENQRITMIRQQTGRQRTRTTNPIKHILRRHNLQWSLPTKTFPTVKAIAWLKTVTLPTWDRLEMDYHLEEFERQTNQQTGIKKNGKSIERPKLSQESWFAVTLIRGLLEMIHRWATGLHGQHD
jgi:hypothetical protein